MKQDTIIFAPLKSITAYELNLCYAISDCYSGNRRFNKLLSALKNYPKNIRRHYRMAVFDTKLKTYDFGKRL